MEPITLAGAAVGLLVPLFKGAFDGSMARIGERISDAGADALRRLHARIKERLAGNAYDEQLLAGVEEDPDNPVRRRNLEQTLASLIESDDEFAAELRELVEGAKAGGATVVHATDSGITAGGDVSVHAGGDVTGRDKTIGDVPPRRAR